MFCLLLGITFDIRNQLLLYGNNQVVNIVYIVRLSSSIIVPFDPHIIPLRGIGNELRSVWILMKIFISGD